MKKYCLLLVLICTSSIKATLSCLPPQDGENLWRLVSQFYDCFSDLDADIASTVDMICSCVEEEITSLVDSVCSCIDSVSDVITNELSLIDTQLLSIAILYKQPSYRKAMPYVAVLTPPSIQLPM